MRKGAGGKFMIWILGEHEHAAMGKRANYVTKEKQGKVIDTDLSTGRAGQNPVTRFLFWEFLSKEGGRRQGVAKIKNHLDDGDDSGWLSVFVFVVAGPAAP